MKNKKTVDISQLEPEESNDLLNDLTKKLTENINEAFAHAFDAAEVELADMIKESKQKLGGTRAPKKPLTPGTSQTPHAPQQNGTPTREQFEKMIQNERQTSAALEQMIAIQRKRKTAHSDKLKGDVYSKTGLRHGDTLDQMHDEVNEADDKRLKKMKLDLERVLENIKLTTTGKEQDILTAQTVKLQQSIAQESASRKTVMGKIGKFMDKQNIDAVSVVAALTNSSPLAGFLTKFVLDTAKGHRDKKREKATENAKLKNTLMDKLPRKAAPDENITHLDDSVVSLVAKVKPEARYNVLDRAHKKKLITTEQFNNHIAEQVHPDFVPVARHSEPPPIPTTQQQAQQPPPTAQKVFHASHKRCGFKTELPTGYNHDVELDDNRPCVYCPDYVASMQPETKAEQHTPTPIRPTAVERQRKEPELIKQPKIVPQTIDAGEGNSFHVPNWTAYLKDTPKKQQKADAQMAVIAEGDKRSKERAENKKPITANDSAFKFMDQMEQDIADKGVGGSTTGGNGKRDHTSEELLELMNRPTTMHPIAGDWKNPLKPVMAPERIPVTQQPESEKLEKIEEQQLEVLEKIKKDEDAILNPQRIAAEQAVPEPPILAKAARAQVIPMPSPTNERAPERAAPQNNEGNQQLGYVKNIDLSVSGVERLSEQQLTELQALHKLMQAQLDSSESARLAAQRETHDPGAGLLDLGKKKDEKKEKKETLIDNLLHGMEFGAGKGLGGMVLGAVGGAGSAMLRGVKNINKKIGEKLFGKSAKTVEKTAEGVKDAERVGEGVKGATKGAEAVEDTAKAASTAGKVAKGAEGAAEAAGGLAKGAEVVEEVGVMGKMFKGLKIFGKLGRLAELGETIPIIGEVIAVVMSIVDFFSGFMKADSILDKAKEKLTLFDRISAGLGNVLGSIIGIFDMLLGLVGIKTDFGGIVTKATGKIFASIFNIIGDVFKVLWDVGKVIFKIGAFLVKITIGPLISLLKKIPWETLGKMLETFIKPFVDMFEAISKYADAIVDFVDKLTGDNPMEAFKEPFKNLKKYFIEAIESIGKAILHFFGLDMLLDLGKGIKDAFKNAFGVLTKWVGDLFGPNTFDKLKHTAQTIIDLVTHPFDTLTKWVGDLFGPDIFDKLKHTLQTIINLVTHPFDTVTNMLGGGGETKPSETKPSEQTKSGSPEQPKSGFWEAAKSVAMSATPLGSIYAGASAVSSYFSNKSPEPVKQQKEAPAQTQPASTPTRTAAPPPERQTPPPAPVKANDTGVDPIKKDEFSPFSGKDGWVSPASGPLVSKFGNRLLNGKPDFHPGVDIGAPEGTPIKAAKGGKIRYIGPAGDAGNLVEIDHGNQIVSRYMHMSKFGRFGQGDSVKANDIIGYVGHTGHVEPKGPAGAHLHFEVRQGPQANAKNRKPMNPAEYVGLGGTVKKKDEELASASPATQQPSSGVDGPGAESLSASFARVAIPGVGVLMDLAQPPQKVEAASAPATTAASPVKTAASSGQQTHTQTTPQKTETTKGNGKVSLDYMANSIMKMENPWKGAGLKLNNPGHLEFNSSAEKYYDAKKIPGQRFAKFDSWETGYQALKGQIRWDAQRGMTLGKFIEKFAPKNENKTAAYVAFMANKLGASPDSKLTDIVSTADFQRQAQQQDKKDFGNEKYANKSGKDQVPMMSDGTTPSGPTEEASSKKTEKQTEIPATAIPTEQPLALASSSTAIQDRMHEDASKWTKPSITRVSKEAEHHLEGEDAKQAALVDPDFDDEDMKQMGWKRTSEQQKIVEEKRKAADTGKDAEKTADTKSPEDTQKPAPLGKYNTIHVARTTKDKDGKTVARDKDAVNTELRAALEKIQRGDTNTNRPRWTPPSGSTIPAKFSRIGRTLTDFRGGDPRELKQGTDFTDDIKAGARQQISNVGKVVDYITGNENNNATVDAGESNRANQIQSKLAAENPDQRALQSMLGSASEAPSAAQPQMVAGAQKPIPALTSTTSTERTARFAKASTEMFRNNILKPVNNLHGGQNVKAPMPQGNNTKQHTSLTQSLDANSTEPTYRRAMDAYFVRL